MPLRPHGRVLHTRVNTFACLVLRCKRGGRGRSRFVPHHVRQVRHVVDAGVRGHVYFRVAREVPLLAPRNPKTNVIPVRHGLRPGVTHDVEKVVRISPDELYALARAVVDDGSSELAKHALFAVLGVVPGEKRHALVALERTLHAHDVSAH